MLVLAAAFGGMGQKQIDEEAMNIRLYFDRSYAPFKAPARITVSNFEDRSRAANDLPLSCETSDGGSWHKGWTEVPASERARHLFFALHKLAKQQHRAKDALSIKHDDCVRMAIADSGPDHVGVTLVLSNNVIGTSEFWYLSLEFHRPDGTVDKIGWDQLRDLHPFPYEHILREAVVRSLRKEAEMKEMHGLKPTARFEDLEIAFKVTGERFRAAELAVTGHEPWSVAHQ
jgi:hypothetical protein